MRGYESSNQNLCIRAMECHSRFTRFCLGTTRTETENILIAKVITLFIDPLIYAVGLIVNPNFIDGYLKPLIDEMAQVSSSMVSLSKSIVIGLLNGNW
jgi:hypothetical protein